MAKENQSGSRFVVDLGEVKLPPVLEKQVEAEIRAVVLRALAQTGVTNGQDASQSRVSRLIWDDFPGQTLGLWPGWPEQKPPVIFGPAFPEPLTARDHTIVMAAIMEHSMDIVRNLPSQYKKKGSNPPGKIVFQAALQVEQIDGYTKSRIQAMLDILPKLEEAQANAPESVKRVIDNLRQELAGKSTEDKLKLLRSPSRLGSLPEVNDLRESMEVSAQILEDGENSIYSVKHPFYKQLRGGGTSNTTARVVDDVKDADAIGASGGGLLGSIFPGLGTAAGAAAGGGGASAGAAIGSFINWLLE